MPKNTKTNKFRIKAIKHVCDKCGHKETYTLPGLIAKVIVTVLLAFGIVALAMIAYLGPGYVVTSFVDAEMYRYASVYHEELRDMALNLTSVDGNEPYIAAREIVDNLGRIRYVLPSPFEQIQDPFLTYEKGGDCKNTAILFSSLMVNLGYRAKVSCNVEQNHCVSYVFGPGDTYMVVDLASDVLYVFNRSDDYWAEDSQPVWAERLGRVDYSKYQVFPCNNKLTAELPDGTICYKCLDENRSILPGALPAGDWLCPV